MSNEVSPFNALSVADKVREKIQATFADLIPEETWKEMIRTEIKRFVSETREYGSQKKSPLATLIEAEIEKKFRTEIGKALDAPAFGEAWNQATNSYGASAVVKTVLEQMTSEMVVMIFQRVAQDVVNAIRNNMVR